MPEINFRDWLNREAKRVNETVETLVARLPNSAKPAATHVLEAGGKRMRPLLTVLCARALGYREDDVYYAGAAMETLHAATLLHDDVIDNAESRRGREAAHVKFGSLRAILAGDALLALGNSVIAGFADPAMSECYSKAVMETAAGEILETDFLGDPNLSESDYLRIVVGKTACLISQACLMGALLAKAPESLARACETFGENLGVAFQIVDDALDFAPGAQTGKPRGGDLREGKMTPPIRLYRQSLSPEAGARFDAHFASGTFPAAEFSRVADAIASFADAALKFADEYLARAAAALEKLPPSEEKVVLGWMIDYVRSRQN